MRKAQKSLRLLVMARCDLRDKPTIEKDRKGERRNEKQEER